MDKIIFYAEVDGMANKVWFTADTHFGHQRTLELSKRPFKTVEEMDNAIIENWNSIVAKNDTVYHLGDFGDYKVREKLNGNIYLVLGNYERSDLDKGMVTLDDLLDLFKSVYKQIDIAKINNQYYQMVHEPTHRVNDKFKLFGHIHKLQMVKRNALNVGVDCHNFTPISIETVEFYRNAIENHYDEEVFS
jgi:calcineurin-like phosphoesterase family protein